MCKVNSPLYYVQKTSSASPTGKHGNTSWVPNTDVYVSEGTLVINVELAGIRQEDLELFVDGSRLSITGQRPDGCRGANKCKFLVMEINYGPFECVVEIPKGFDLALAKATYTNGFLRVSVPASKTPSSSPRIPIAADD